MISLAEIEAARERLRGQVRVTPFQKSDFLSRQLDCEVYLKLENLQLTGSFKERGSLNRLLGLTPEERGRGVVTASAGNHAQGVAYHAGRLGIPATIFMPEGSALTKVTATRGFGARVILEGVNYDEASEKAREFQRREGLVFIHPFDDDLVIAGQGTLGLEMLEQQPDLDAVLIAVGGGGLAAGVSVAMKARNPSIELIGVETSAFSALTRSLMARERVTVDAAPTIADGIAVRTLGERTFDLLRLNLSSVVTVDDEEIARALLWLLEREKTVAEGAGAAALAGLFQIAPSLKGKRVAVIICGGNIDVNLVARVIERGLVKVGRVIRLAIKLPDRPGSLARLAQVLAEQHANVLEIVHDRTSERAALGEVLIEVKFETRGFDHIAELTKILQAKGFDAQGER